MIFNSIFKSALRRGLGFKFKSSTTVQPKIFTLAFLSEIKETSVIRKCQFHTTSPKNAPPIILVFLLRYAMKLGAILSGRAIRKWWQKLSPEEKVMVLNKIRSKKSKIACAGTVFAGGMFIYYLEHIVEEPLTKRKKFIMLNQKQMTQLGEFEYLSLMNSYRSAVVPTYHPLHRRVERVANSLILSNLDLEGIKTKIWSVTVVDRPEVTNASVLPNGRIFVFTGMLNICTNDDQLAVVLSHEIAHAILYHPAERVSRLFLIDFLLIVPSFIIWMIFPDALALFSNWVTSSLSEVFFHLPFSRAIEREADIVGLHLSARSCFDVREAPVFWGKMKFVSGGSPEWLSTHPSSDSRQLQLHSLLPSVLQLREECKCPPLRPKPVYVMRF